MQFIPQTDLTEEYTCPFIKGNVVFVLHVFGMTTFVKFQKLLTRKKKLPAAQYHAKMMSLGIKEVVIDGEVSKDKSMTIPPAAIMNISDRIFNINAVAELGK
jgi:hypothetical protein